MWESCSSRGCVLLVEVLGGEIFFLISGVLPVGKKKKKTLRCFIVWNVPSLSKGCHNKMLNGRSVQLTDAGVMIKD